MIEFSEIFIFLILNESMKRHKKYKRKKARKKENKKERPKERRGKDYILLIQQLCFMV